MVPSHPACPIAPMTTLHRVTPPARRGRTPSNPGGETAQGQSLTRGLSILQCLASTEGGLTLTDIAQRVQLPTSTTHRLLSTLEKNGYVDQVQCRETMRTIVKLGSRVPRHASGVGKAIFA